MTNFSMNRNGLTIRLSPALGLLKHTQCCLGQLALPSGYLVR
jgi:hypothetical protein